LPDVRYSRLARRLRPHNTPYLSSLNPLALSAPGGARRFRPTPSAAFGNRRGEWFKSQLHTENEKQHPKTLNGGIMGVAFVEADTKHWAMHTFQQLYAGQYYTIDKCEELFKR